MSDIKLANITKIEENLNDIADAIRLKTNEEEDIAFDDMATEIAKIRVSEYAWEEPYIYKNKQGKLIISSNASDYVQDGLIMQLDGIDNTGNGHDANATTWIDLTGNGYNVTIGDAYRVVHDKYVEISRALNSVKAFTPSQVQHIEIVFRPNFSFNNTNPKVFLPWGGNNGVYISRYGNFYCGNIAGGNYTPLDDTKPWIISIHRAANPKIIYINGVEPQLGTNSEGSSWAGSSTTRLFGYNGDTGTYVMTGKVYALRMYNRILSPSEVIDNFVLDRKRFDLWQTLES